VATNAGFFPALVRVQEAVKRECLFQRMHIFTLDIFDQLRFDTSRVRKFDDANGHFFQRGEVGGA
jgi:hypothetical protein